MTTHPATRAMVDYHAGWYDRHFDLEWQDMLLTLSNANEERIPVAFLVPKSADDLRLMGRSFATPWDSAGDVRGLGGDARRNRGLPADRRASP